MQNAPTVNPPPSSRLAGIKRKSINLQTAELVHFAPLQEGKSLPLLARPALPQTDLGAWITGHRVETLELLRRHGGILFRGFSCGLSAFAQAVSEKLLEYNERSSPRTSVSDKVYTSTEHPASEPIFFHNENSYQKYFPKFIVFACETPATSGGATPIADTRRVYEHIRPEVREKFLRKHVRYVRNFAPGLGLSWQTVFNTTDPRVVEEYCRKAEIEFEWLGEQRLRTQHVRPAVLRHPDTGEMSWFNHATFFHHTTLPEKTRRMLETLVKEEDLPNNTYYGDGERIEDAVMEEIRAAYQRETVRFDWAKGDILLLDNLLVAHAREPFEGARRVLVAMMDAVTRESNG